jgi:hypothetical protein
MQNVPGTYRRHVLCDKVGTVFLWRTALDKKSSWLLIKFSQIQSVLEFDITPAVLWLYQKTSSITKF